MIFPVQGLMMVDDEYYVCAYVMKDNNRTDDVTASTIPLYDCDEGKHQPPNQHI